MRLFDTHCHLQDRKFEGEFSGVVARARKAGVGGMLLCGWDVASSEHAVALAGGHDDIFPAAGIHPHDASDASPAALDRIAALARDPRVVAIGEIGLDHYRDLSPHDLQLDTLEAHLAIAVDAGKPVSVHSRAAEEAIYEPLAAYARRSQLATEGRPVGVMHCFAGPLDLARRYVDLGFVVSVPCTVTYPNNDVGRSIAASLPLDALVIETDSPYLPPQDRRGRRNEPSYIGAPPAAIAALRGISAAEVADATTRNAERVFGVSIAKEAVAR
jgi:TatD DNase family protein